MIKTKNAERPSKYGIIILGFNPSRRKNHFDCLDSRIFLDAGQAFGVIRTNKTYFIGQHIIQTIV